MVEWLMAMEPWRQALVLGGSCLIVVGLGVWIIHHGWTSVDPTYRGDRRRLRVPEPWDREPATGELILTPEARHAGQDWRARMMEEDRDGGGTLSWPVHPDQGRPIDRTRMIQVPVREVGTELRSLDPAWRKAIMSPTGTWSMPNSGRRHHHRATGGRGEETRQLHPGYVAEARARVARGEPADPDHLLD